MTRKIVHAPAELIQATANYLGTKPYVEVAGLLSQILGLSIIEEIVADPEPLAEPAAEPAEA